VGNRGEMGSLFMEVCAQIYFVVICFAHVVRRAIILMAGVEKFQYFGVCALYVRLQIAGVTQKICYLYAIRGLLSDLCRVLSLLL
jgi:hypothetical protein